MDDRAEDPSRQLARLTRRLERERRARMEAERIAEHATSELFELVARLRESKVVLDETPDLVAIVSTDGEPSYLNRAFQEMLGIVDGGTEGVNLWELLDDEARVTLAIDAMPALQDKGVWRGELAIVRPNGAVMPVSQVLVAHRRDDGQVRGISSISRDITERQEIAARLAKQALHDPLTGLPNRILIVDRLDRALQACARQGSLLAVLFIDLDRFKLINDGLGHGAGDDLLRVVAGRITGAVRAVDTVGRLGGDEFVAICEDITDEDDVLALVARIETALAEPCLLRTEEVFVGASIGIAIGGGYEEAEEVIRQADEAMYQAKRAGRGRYEVFRAGLRVQAAIRLETENALYRSLDADELTLHYQPIMDLEHRRMVAVEALLRWRHPTRGLLAPDQFIHIAEDDGLIVPIGTWALREACRQAALWRAGPALTEIRVAVNVSPRQLSQPGFADAVTEALRDAGLPPASLDLELTESLLIGANPTVLAELARLKAVGVDLGTDDFGTGYSSFSYLKQFKADFLKIDRSFIAGLTTSDDDRAIVQAMLWLGRGLRMRVVAEGVETADQLDQLEQLGCRYAQGYLFSRPVPADEIAPAGGWWPKGD